MPAIKTSTRAGIGCGMLILLLASFVVMAGNRQGNNFITFGTLWASGRAAANHLNPYRAYPETYRGLNYTPSGIDGTFPDLNLNPPWTLPALQELSHLSLQRFMRVWALITAACYFAGLLLMIYANPALQGRQVIWFALAIPTLSTLYSGQVYGWAFLFGALALFWYERDQWLAAGITIGMAVGMRPTMAFWLLLLVLGRFRRIGTIAIATCFALYASALVIYGPTIYTEWMDGLANDKHWLNPYDIAIMPTFRRQGHPLAGIAIAILIVALVCWWTAHNRPNFVQTSGAAISLGILCAPLAWYHYVLFLSPFLMARRWNVLSTVGASLFLVAPGIPDRVHGWIYLFGAILILASFIAPEQLPNTLALRTSRKIALPGKRAAANPCELQ